MKGQKENYRSKPKCECQTLIFDYMKKKGAFCTIFFQPMFVSLGDSKNRDSTTLSKSPNMLFHDGNGSFFFFIIFFREVKEGIQAVASEPNNMAP